MGSPGVRAPGELCTRFARARNLPEAERVKNFRSFLLVAAASLLLAVTASAKPGWLTNFKQAQDDAKAGKKLLLLDFTGSDWCGWCMKLDKEVFSKPEFKEYADKNLVLLEVDFPRMKQMTRMEKAQNSELAEKYQIQGYPTIIVLDGDGNKVGEFGYMPGGPSAVIAELDKMRKS